MKKKKYKNDIVYSTDPNYQVEIENESTTTLDIPAEQQLLYIELDRKLRKGKAVTVISNFIGRNDTLKALAKDLKNLCAVGGTVKNSQIEIQGDFRDKIEKHLKNLNYKTRRKG